MSEKRETILRLLQDETGRITDVKVEQQPVPEPTPTPDPKNPLTVIELKPDTKTTALYTLSEGVVVDWGDGTKSVVNASDVERGDVRHTYATSATSNRVVTIDGEIDRTGRQERSVFDTSSLVAVRSLGTIRGSAVLLFSGCRSLTTIPKGLFDHCTALTSFSGCFKECSALTTIPEGLFDKLAAVESFVDCFYGCNKLKAIPSGLFDHCTKIFDLVDCFFACTNLTGETPYTMVDGKKVPLWRRYEGNGFRRVRYANGCFKGCTGLSDYAEIPDVWK